LFSLNSEPPASAGGLQLKLEVIIAEHDLGG